MVDRVRRMPVLLIVTFRPEFQQSWVGQPHVTILALNRLDDRHVAALVLGLAGNTPIGSEVVQEIAEHTDGVPCTESMRCSRRSDQPRSLWWRTETAQDHSPSSWRLAREPSGA
jgi:hypothetical protein